MDGELGSQYRESKISRDEFWHQALLKLEITEGADELETQWIQGYELIEGTRDIILELSEKYKVYYLSDNVRERVERINDTYHFMEWFEDGVFSHEVGVRKPSPKIYQFVLEKAGVSPEEAVFIDDKASALEPARAMGIATILFQNPDDLKQRLIQEKVLI